ncbi:lipocalin-like domain-containing protein [Skermanella stibiiresistens]|nr:lipocalin-like domain-containing protein [Skermanella stibiiresistens]
MTKRRAMLAAAAIVLSIASPVAAQTLNKVVGTWQMTAATVEVNGTTSLPYGSEPQGKLVFTSDLHFVEFLHDPRIPRFKSNERGKGTDEENRAVMAGTLALYGRYTVDARGDFSGNTVEGSSFPNWIGDVRTTNELKMEVDGNRMIEKFQRPGGAKVTIVWERVR